MRKNLFKGIRFLLCTIGLILFVIVFKSDQITVNALSGLSVYIMRNNFPISQYLGFMKGPPLFIEWESPLMEYVSEHGNATDTVYAMMPEVDQDLVKEENGSLDEESEDWDESVQTIGPVSFIFGETFDETELDDEWKDATEASATINSQTSIQSQKMIEELRKNKDSGFLIQNFYIVDGTTSISKKIFNVKQMLENDYSIQKDNSVPQILIYHTHGASEQFKGGGGEEEDSIVGVGNHLADILTSQYGYNVLHDKTKYDWIDGEIDRNRAYGAALPAIRKTLEENSSIEVVIDLHRDGVGKDMYTYTEVNGKKAAQIMFFNGMSRNKQGEITYLNNPNRKDNLSFSLQLKLAAMEKYPGLTKPIYLKGYRYNMHLAKRCLLIELGNQNNSLEEAMNAVPPLADILNGVLTPKE